MKNIKFLAMLFMAVMACAGFSACSDDDDDDNNGGGSSNVTGNESALVKDGKMLLTSITVGDYETTTLGYDDKLRPVYVNEEYYDDIEPKFSIDYNTGKITIEDDYENLSVSFNSKGYVTKIQGSWKEEDDEYYQDYGTISWTYSYDGSGHLVGVDKNDTEEGEKIVGKIVLTWENGNLMKVEDNEVFYDDKGNVEEKNSYIQTFTYGNQINKYKQFPEVYGDDEEYMLFIAGLLGVGSEKLPLTCTSLEIDEYDGYTHKYENSVTSEFTLNEDGTIDTETWFDSATGSRNKTSKFNYTPTDEYKTGQTRTWFSPDMAKSKTTAKGNRKRHSMKRRLSKMMGI